MGGDPGGQLRLGRVIQPGECDVRGKTLAFRRHADALQRIGVAPERKRFAPHVTLARLDKAAEPKLAAWVAAHNLFRTPPVQVEHFTLFSSQLGKEQSVYTPEVEYALA